MSSEINFGKIKNNGSNEIGYYSNEIGYYKDKIKSVVKYLYGFNHSNDDKVNYNEKRK